MTSKPEISDGR